MSDRWCPLCQGAKSPSEPICMACAITRKNPESHVVTIEHRPAVPGAEMPLKYDAWRWTCSCGASADWRNTESNARRGHTLHVTTLTGRPALRMTRPV